MNATFAPVQYLIHPHREAQSSPVKSCQGFFVPSYQSYSIVDSGVVPPCYGCNDHSSPMWNRAGQRDGQHRFLLPKNVQNQFHNVPVPIFTNTAQRGRCCSAIHPALHPSRSKQLLRGDVWGYRRVVLDGASTAAQAVDVLPNASVVRQAVRDFGLRASRSCLTGVAPSQGQPERERFSSKIANLLTTKPSITMRNYHDKQGLGDLPAEKFTQSKMGLSIVMHYLSQHRKYEAMVRQTINPDDLNALQPDVIFYRKDPNHKWGIGKAIVVVEIEDHKVFKNCQAQCQKHLSQNPELLEAFAYNFDKKQWFRYTQGQEKPVRTSFSEVLNLYLKNLK